MRREILPFMEDALTTAMTHAAELAARYGDRDRTPLMLAMELRTIQRAFAYEREFAAASAAAEESR